MKVKVSELSDPALDWAVSKAEGHYLFLEVDGKWRCEIGDNGPHDIGTSGKYGYSPSTDWSQGGPLIDEYDPEERRLPELDRYAEIWLDRSGGSEGVGRGVGKTRLIAFCRALVNAKLSDEIEIPDELLATA